MTRLRHFFQHVNKCIFEDNEPRLLFGLQTDFNNLLDNYNMEHLNRQDRLKDMLIKEFGERIGFHKRYHVNESTIVYNTSGGGCLGN